MDELQRLIDVLRDAVEDVDFESETALVDGGVLDSFDILAVIAALNEAYGIQIKPAEIEPENFNSAQTMLETVNRCRRRL